MVSRVVCWKNREEWIETYHGLFEFEKPHLQRKAMDRVQAWKSRSNGKLPLAIESTANLIAAHLHIAVNSHSLGKDEASPGAVEKKLLLAMALVRFVNGMVDLEQKGMYARSMQSIAEEIGLPDWLIDLRHEATHASLPSFETLLSGLRVALAWLRDEYWEAQITKQGENRESIVRFLKDYKERAVLDLTAKAKKPSRKAKVAKSDPVKSALAETVREITSLASSGNLWNEILSALLEGQLLRSSPEDLAKLGVEWPDPTENYNESLPRLPDQVISLWKPLFKSINKVSSKFIPTLVISLLECLPEASQSQAAEEFAGWVNYFLAPSSVPKFVNTHNAEEGFSWFVLLEKSLIFLSPYSPAVISIILQHTPQVPQALQEKIKALPLVFGGTTDFLCHNGKCYSVDDLNELRRSKRIDEPKTREIVGPQDSQAWSLASGPTPWHKIPLGEVLAAGDESPNNLELFQANIAVVVNCQDDKSSEEEMQDGCFEEENSIELEEVDELGMHEMLDCVTRDTTPMDTGTLDVAAVASRIWLL